MPAAGASANRIDLRDRRLDHGDLVGLGDGFEYGARVAGPSVVQGREHSEHLQLGVGVAAYVVDRVEELTHATMRQRLALQRDHHLVSSRQRRHGEHAERRWAVQEDPVVVVGDVLQRCAQCVFSARPGQQRGLGAGELDRRRQQVGALIGLVQDIGGIDLAQQHLVDRLFDLLGIDAEREGQARLRVEVDQQHLLAEVVQGDSEGDHRSGLGDAALLVGDRECGGHREPLCHCAGRDPVTPREMLIACLSP